VAANSSSAATSATSARPIFFSMAFPPCDGGDDGAFAGTRLAWFSVTMQLDLG
jgi:hypothetical protein